MPWSDSQYDSPQMNAMQRVRRRLAALLDERTPAGKLRQKRLAKYLNKSEAWISNILAGRKGLRLVDLDAVAEFFNLPPGELVRHDDDLLVELTPSELAVIRRLRRLTADDLHAHYQLLGLPHLVVVPDRPPETPKRKPARKIKNP
jgi:transcriptional regulator with XRE-family HTH domain